MSALPDPAIVERAGFERRPPAGRGDVRALLTSNVRPGTIVVVDGRFHQSLALGHAELRDAIEAGWVLWGLGSMGAIRAFEMRWLGMRGFGRVYEHFLGDEDFQDDEVALVQSPVAPYVAMSEPLIHLRYCLADLAKAGDMEYQAAQDVADRLKDMWYGERDLAMLVACVTAAAGPRAAAAARARTDAFGGFRVKSLDLRDFFEARCWSAASYEPTPSPAPFSRTPYRATRP